LFDSWTMHCVLFVFTDEERWVRTERSAVWRNARPCHGYMKSYVARLLAAVRSRGFRYYNVWLCELLNLLRCESAGGVPVGLARVRHRSCLNIWASDVLNAVSYASWRCAVLAMLLLCETLLPDEASEHCCVLEIVIFDCSESLQCVGRCQVIWQCTCITLLAVATKFNIISVRA
jgi:hypothetical protein